MPGLFLDIKKDFQSQGLQACQRSDHRCVQGTAPFVRSWPTPIHSTSQVSDGAFLVEGSGHQDVSECGARSECEGVSGP